MLTTASYLYAIRHWQGKQRSSSDRFIRGCCPLHHERRPSFQIDTSDQHWWCYAEQRGGTLIGMINEIEFGGVYRKDVWNACYKRARELNGGPLPDEIVRAPIIPIPIPVANQEQQAVLTTAMHWWHEHLWLRSVTRGRAYFEQRGVLLSKLRDSVQLGYAPPYSHQHYNRTFASFASSMRYHVGTDWQRPAKELGLLWERSGTMAVQDRILFCCTNEQGQCVFYQGRAIERPGDPPRDPDRRFYKYMSPWGIHKMPFSLPITNPRVAGTLHVESPVGPAVLAGYSIRAVGHLGAIPSGTQLALYPGPHYIATDNDVAHFLKNGDVFYPGETQAQKLIEVCQQEQQPYARVLPPLDYKDMDTWIQREGIDPLLQALHDQQTEHFIAC